MRVDLSSLLIDPAERSCMEYYHNVTFGLCCYLFKSDIPNQGGSSHFVKSGFKAWNRKSGLDDHKAGTPHIITVQKCQNLMNQRQSITTAFYKQTTLQEK
uniref:TTF-type domain-containing protein n=1 Tax=Lactuca sativa TaxID=4236 RepID=A0A9R1WWJ3_LACSA|nr:hypothetical protein LSAT_V11C800435110 [Lactuca sativa]